MPTLPKATSMPVKHFYPFRAVEGLWRTCAVLLLAACAQPSNRCIPGASVPCACISSGPGAQVCQQDGTFGTCVCSGGGSDSGSVDSGMGHSDAGSTSDAGPIVDAGSTDAGATDAGSEDGGIDAGPHDAGSCSLPLRDAGHCTFQLMTPGISLGAPAVPGYVDVDAVMADVNRDGFLDVVVTDTGGLGLDIVINAGDGGFLAPQTLVTGHDCYDVTATDLNHDGWPDLVVSCYTSGITAYLNEQDGGFSSAWSTSILDSAGVATADFNGDGAPDIAVAASSDVVLVLSGVDGGHSTASISGTIFSGCTAVAAADLNGDGRPDLVVPYFYSPSTFEGLSVFLNQGAGTFRTPTSYGENGHTAPVFADFDRNCWPDMAFPDIVYLNNGDGTFPGSLSIAGGGTLVATADVNGDGWPDLLVAGGSVAGIDVLLNDADGGFGPASNFAGGDGVAAWLGTADLNGDGIPDVVAVLPMPSGYAQVFYGQCQ